MRIVLESNFMLMGDSDLLSIDFDLPHVTLAELLRELSQRSSNSLQVVTPDGNAIDEGWDIALNGCGFAGLPDGLQTSLREDDRVAIKLALLGGG